MRSITVATLAALMATAVEAQEQTLIGPNAAYGGYGGPQMKVTQFAGKDVVFMGGRGAFIVNGTYAFGGGGSGWNSERVRGSDGATYQVSVGYGGVDFEYIHRTRRLVHPTLLISVGGGAVTQALVSGGSDQTDSFWFAEPGLHLELNVASTFRLAGGVNYRLVNGLDLPAFSNADLRGASAVVTFKFGKFNQP